MDQKNRFQKSIIHIILQAQIHHKSISDTWRCCDTGSATSKSGTQRKVKDSYGKKCNQPTQKNWIQSSTLPLRSFVSKKKNNIHSWGRSPWQQLQGCRRNRRHIWGWANKRHPHLHWEKPNNKQERCQTTTKSKLHHPRWRQSSSK